MIESVQVRQSGAYDFESHYDNLCALQDSVPVAAVKAHLCQGVLDINGDRVRVNDWMPIINTLRINKSLEFVAVRSYYTPPTEDDNKKVAYQKRKMPAIRSKEITFRLCRALKECASVSSVLRCLELQGLPLRMRDFEALAKGLTKATSLTHLSLEYCRIGGPGIDILCSAIKNCTQLSSLNLTACSLSSQAAESIAQVIKHQAMKRHSEAWRNSLRYRIPDLDRMPGIRRITINTNPMLGDGGATILAEALKDDLWLKALDMQGCGISTSGARVLLDVLKYNTTLVVLDVRANPMIDRELVHNIMEQLIINSNGQDTEYKWIKAEEPVDPRKVRSRKRVSRCLNHSVGKKTTIRVSSIKRRPRASPRGFQHPLNMSHPSPGLPWRTAARAHRYKGYPPEHTPGKMSLDENSEMNQSASVIITRDESTLDETNETFRNIKPFDLSNLSIDMGNTKEVKVEMEMLRRNLKEESIARMKAEQREIKLCIENKRLTEEMKYLRHRAAGGGIVSDVHVGMNGGHGAFIDESFLEGVEASFKKFHKFLDTLQEAGLGQLIAMAGLDQSDLNQFEHLSTTRFSGISFAKPNTPLNNISAASINNDLMVPASVMPIAKSDPSPSDHLYNNIQTILERKQQIIGGSGYFGGISSYGATARQGSFEEEIPITFGPVASEHNLRPGGRVVTSGPKMHFPTNETIISGPDQSDDLYERLVQDTSGVFTHIGPTGSLTSTPVFKTTETKLSSNTPDKDDGHYESISAEKGGRGDGLTSSMIQPRTTSPVEDARTRGGGEVTKDKSIDISDQSDILELNHGMSNRQDSPAHRSKISDYNYSLESFDHGLSARGRK